jgi:transcriptional/translational regulatory protein YebC/TACO1
MLSREELSAKNKDIDELELSLIDQGVSDVARDEDGMIVYAELADFQKIQDFLQTLDLKNESAEIEYVAKEKIALNATDQEKFDKLLEELEDNEEVSAVYSNILD